ncbi:hypothetical protein BCV69DRAFT_247938 [Microstroma glucosiphilum]|uniref:3,4-dihydroxy-2-butanone 4-phosphate synthase n=1 Tax=Pseudomicrostroma glucosiphilum TaxID=1684307 RepID=A0A316U995_9BASI|nr:hypothetical protein BCV69DRAFT_247938 [Pseudomicrostroma glucosiphilum]PWN21408.1 hypothetical protein BCV69DRAFT_247938 [Pseudomicrostroma glucosiphilum]
MATVNGASSSSSSTSTSLPSAAPLSSSSSSTPSHPKFDSIDSAVAEIGRGNFVVVLDDEDRENEGDLIIAADKVTTEQMAWLIRHSSGFVCISLHPSRIAALNLPMMFPNNQEPNKTAYTVTVDYKHNTTTGISAHDRALTSRMLAATGTDAKGEAAGARANAQDFTRPGHLCPLRYTEGGVRVRRGHTEAAVDLATAANLPPAALLCELVDPDSPQGSIASRDACFKFARQHDLKIITIDALKAWREEKEGPLPAELVKIAGSAKQRGVDLQEQSVVGPRA